jgi:hypothetical protein
MSAHTSPNLSFTAAQPGNLLASSATSSPVVKPRKIPLHVLQGTPTSEIPDLFLPSTAHSKDTPPAAIAAAVSDAPATDELDEFESATLFEPRIRLYDHFTEDVIPQSTDNSPKQSPPVASAPILIPSPAASPALPLLLLTSTIHPPNSLSSNDHDRSALTTSPSFDFSSVVRAESLSASSFVRAATMMHEEDEDGWAIVD